MTGSSANLLVIGAAQVHQHLTYSQCVPLVREAMVGLSRGDSPKLQRSALPVGDDAVFGIMPGMIGGARPAFGAKLLGIFPDPERPSHRRHQGVVVLFDGRSGAPRCVVDAEAVTAIRTACASAVATEALARPDARRLAIFGYGLQAESHLAALSSCRAYESVVIWGRDPARAREFAAAMAARHDLPVRAEASAQQAAAQAQVICTVTGASEPILLGAWVRPGTHVNVVGSSVAGPVEVDNDLVAMSRFYVDSRPSALAQAAEFLRAKQAGRVGDDHIAGEIGEVLCGMAAGRRDAQEVTVYKSLGNIVQDLAAADYLARVLAPASAD